MLVILDSLGLATLTPYYLSVVLGRFSDFIGEASDQIGLACIVGCFPSAFENADDHILGSGPL